MVIVAVDWDDTKYLEGEPGQYITVARKEKDTNKWFLGSVNGEQARSSSISLNFLDPSKKYLATIYEDGPGAHYKTNPQSYKITQKTVRANDALKLNLAPGGGTAISFVPEDAQEILFGVKESGFDLTDKVN